MSAAPVARAALRALWFAIIPALAAALVVERLVPGAGSGASGILGLLGDVWRRFPAPFGVSLFLLFSVLARYWRRQLPGALYLERAPAPIALRWTSAMTLALSVAGAGALALGLRACVAESYSVLSASMLPTLAPGDRVVGNRFARAQLPRRGDIVVFRSAEVGIANSGDALWIKRVIGLPGDLVEMHASTPVINGWEVPSCDAGPFVAMLPGGDLAFNGYLRVEFLDGHAYVTTRVAMVPPVEPYRVKAGEVFVLGDNRAASLDSRAFHEGHGGGVPLGAIEARADRFLVGTRREGDADLSRILHPLDALHLPQDGLDSHEVDAAVARCLAGWPKDTQPPPPAPRAARDGGAQAVNGP